MRLRRRPVNKDVEKQVLIGFITSDKICHTLKNLLDPKLFQLSVGQTVSRWIKEYYSLYNRAPQQDIQEIYLAERSNLDEEVALDVSQFLQTISEQYTDNPPNEDYLLDKAGIYLEKQSLLLGIKEANLILENSNGDKSAISAAKAALGKGEKNLVGTNLGINILEPERILEFMEEDENPLIKLKEPLGTFLGPLHRGYLIGIMGSMKRGKTWMLQKMATECLENGLRVIFISLEMPWKKLAKRFLQQIGCFAKTDGLYDFPVFDCSKNKYNKCEYPQRTCSVKKGEEGYYPCTACKEGKNGLSLYSYLEKVERPGITSRKAIKVSKNFGLHHGKNNLRVLTYPAFSANLSRILNDIDALEWQEGFIPDVIALDYPTILAPENGQSSQNKEYVSLGETWKTLKGLAEEKQVLIFAPTQTDKSGTEVSYIKIKNTAGYVQIIAHMDKCLTLNQDEIDYTNRIMRIGKIADRWEEMDQSKEIRALTQLQCGQPLINGLIVKREQKEK